MKTTNMKFTLPVLFTLFLSFVASELVVQVDYFDCKTDVSEPNPTIHYKSENDESLYMELFQCIWRASPSYVPLDNKFFPAIPCRKMNILVLENFTGGSLTCQAEVGYEKGDNKDYTAVKRFFF
jgi:hypothetical protein